MALQGELESFAITDVLRLLSATGKSGRLEVDGDRGRVVAWFRGGGIAGGQVSAAPHAHEPVDVVFELLRFGHGSFRFEDDVLVVESHEPLPVDDLLTQADAMLTEWQALRATVPTIDMRLCLAPEIASAEVVVSRDRWRALAQVACAASVHEVGDRLAITDLAAWRMVRDLVTDGLVVLSPDDLNPMADVATLSGYRGRIAGRSAQRDDALTGGPVDDPVIPGSPAATPMVEPALPDGLATATARAAHPSQRPAAEWTFASAARDRPLRDSDGSNGATHLRTVEDEPSTLVVTVGPAAPAPAAEGDQDEDPEANRSSLLRFLSTVRG